LELDDRAYGFAWIEFPKCVCLFAGSMLLKFTADGVFTIKFVEFII